jgi:hypothetical protein
MAKVINLPILAPTPTAEEQAEAETRHKRALLNWALAVLQRMGLDKAIEAANSWEELHALKLDLDSPDIISAIHAALHQGNRQEHFVGLTRSANPGHECSWPPSIRLLAAISKTQERRFLPGCGPELASVILVIRMTDIR